MALSTSDERDARWMQVEVEPELPSHWKKFICLKDNKPIKKLAKYEDPEGKKYKNLKFAMEAFVKMKDLDVSPGRHTVQKPAPLVSNGKRKSFPLKVEEVSPSKRQNILNIPSLIKNVDMASSSDRRKSLPSVSKQKSEPVLVARSVVSNFAKQGLEIFSCNSCNITYTTSASLQVHMKEQHSKKNKKVAPVKSMFQCDLCKKSYQTLEFLKKHKMQEHAKILPQEEAFIGSTPSQLSCNICNLVIGTKKQLKKHNRKLHMNSQTPISNSHAMMPLNLTPLHRKSSFPPGPSLIPAGVQDTNEVFSRSELNEVRGSVATKSINILTCEECGEEFHSRKFLNKHLTDKHTLSDKARGVPLLHHVNSASLKTGQTLEESCVPSDVLDQTDDEYQGDHDLEQNIVVDQSLFQTIIPGQGLNIDEEYYNQEDFDEDVPELEIRDLKLKDNDNWNEDYDAEFEQEDYYELDEDDQDDIEVVSSGVNKLAQINDDIEVVEDNAFNVFNRSLVKKSRSLMIQNHQALSSIQNRYSQITITNNADDISDDDDDGSHEGEDYSDLSGDEDTGIPEEITLDDEPDEITLDEDDESEDIVVLNKKGAQEESDMRKNENYEVMIAKTDFVKDLTENPEKLFVFKHNSWYAQPPSWKPTMLGEVWNATVPQVCFHFKLHDYPLQPNWSFRSWDAFDEFFTAPLERINPSKSSSVLFKLKKAKWFHYLDAVVPLEMKVAVETLEEEDIGEEFDILTL